MGFIGTLIIGMIVGFIARMLKPGPDRLGLIATTLLGIAGAMFAGFLGHTVGWYRADEPAGFIASVLGAMVILFIAEAMFGRSRRFR